ncbi:MAG: hypothetical protein K0U29_03300 [Gammaproteobacteria bacterium]|nr:hypothetical protein [Gammaproteobacteria bacterium]MCH9743938.1 hypothetical protein [Gammaproteobacteria bacterium]
MKQAIDKLVPTLTVGGVISNAWGHTKGCKWAIWLPMLAMLACMVVVGVIESLLFRHITPTLSLKFLFNPVISNFIFAPFIAGALMVGVMHLRKQTVCANTGFQYFSIWLPLGIAAIIVGFISGAIVLAGPAIHRGAFIIATLLSIIISALFMITPAAIADKGLTALQGLAYSAKKTIKHLHKLFAIIIINGLIFFVFILPLSLGEVLHKKSLEIIGFIILIGFLVALIWLIPYFILCIADIYNKLSSET